MSVLKGVEELLQQMVMPELKAIRNNLVRRVDRLEADAHEHTGQIRELYSRYAAVEARLEKPGKEVLNGFAFSA